ncbi:phosphoserine phosphatase [Alkalilimnicola ehrlichii]|uniref:Phosphoserine phosphatase n=1 Tax=Alkalilimnicola ehrlichii TaxID=351052 RepID=A0A3E0X0T4_9GAMM|nr:HAD family hydrolase [Alkalilimnicola ehrlichii]RFA31466.1 phosphoserine phosphatase [Alkalilimnicola ehrlichii]RFA39263.1 phosphoserine phosphatase [Alkalilimnicola ehrlichii]
MALAIFDLDNTLIAGDSDFLWGRHLVERGLVDANDYEVSSKQFYQDYLDGTLDIYTFLEFSLQPLRQHPPERLLEIRREFIAQKILPLMLPAAKSLLEHHRAQGDTLLIITATNRFVTEPIAQLLEIEHLLASEPEQINGRYTGRATGIPTFQHGKVQALEAWLKQHGGNLEGSWFYSDSRNDIPLLERVSNPVAVDPDMVLKAYAERNGWPIISLRDGDRAQPRN